MNRRVWRPWWKSYLEKCDQFILAAKKGDYERVAKLINIDFARDQAVNVNYQEGGTGYSALHYAVINNDKRLLNLLVKNYVDCKVQDANLQNPLHLACIKGNIELFKELTTACYKATEGVDKLQKTPLDYARDMGNIEMLDFVKKTTNMLFNIEQNAKSAKSAKNQNYNVTTKDFKRIACLGRGAYAEVFLVQKVDTNNFFAMKRMKKRTYNGLTRFVITEKEVQRKIDNKFIIKLHYAFQTFDYLYMVTDFCPGGDVRSLLNQ